MKNNIYLPAEWEPQSAVQFTFPHRQSDWAETFEAAVACFVNCIEAVSEFEKVIVVCENRVEVTNYLSHIPSERLHLVEIPSNDTWARDHGGITVIENGKPIVLDFQFNAWGLKFAADKDNLITKQLFQHFNSNKIEVRTLGLVLEGGAIESDGKGTLLTTSNCLLSPNRNPHLTKAEIESKLMQLFGLERIMWLNHGYLEGDDTDAHIDTLARFCDERTIAYVKCDDEKDSHFEELAAMEKELQAFKTLDNEPYRLIPLPMPQAKYDDTRERLPATYANFLIVNGGVIVPTYDVPQDEEALQIITNIFPNRKIVGVDCSALIVQHGSLHCITMHYPKHVF